MGLAIEAFGVGLELLVTRMRAEPERETRLETTDDNCGALEHDTTHDLELHKETL